MNNCHSGCMITNGAHAFNMNDVSPNVLSARVYTYHKWAITPMLLQTKHSQTKMYGKDITMHLTGCIAKKQKQTKW